MNIYYFSFGQTHVHSVNGFTYDKDVIVAIQAETSNKSRDIMFTHFDDKWAQQYFEQPDLKYFPRGIKNLNF